MCGRRFKTVLKHPPVFTHFSAQTKAPTLVGDSYSDRFYVDEVGVTTLAVRRTARDDDCVTLLD